MGLSAGACSGDPGWSTICPLGDDDAAGAGPGDRLDDGPGLGGRNLGCAHGQVDEDAVGALIGRDEGVHRGQVDLPSGDTGGDRLRVADRSDGGVPGGG